MKALTNFMTLLLALCLAVSVTCGVQSGPGFGSNEKCRIKITEAINRLER